MTVRGALTSHSGAYPTDTLQLQRKIRGGPVRKSLSFCAN